MIRRDYLLRMIEEFMAMLSRISSLKKGQQWQEATDVLDKEFQRLLGTGAAKIAELSETDLLARLIQGEPTQIVRQKTFMLVTVLTEAAEAAAARGQAAESLLYYSKGLNLLLDTLAEGEASDCPAFVPRVEGLIAALGETSLPMPTQLRLMHYYESMGQFAKAEDALFTLLDTQPNEPALVEFGLQFYRRLQGQSDAALLAGNLPRTELETGIAELKHINST